MQLKKMRRFGTNITSYIDNFYSSEQEVIQYADFKSETSFNNTIEVLLCMGLITSEVAGDDVFYEAKREFKNNTFIATGVSRDQIIKSFLNRLNGEELYAGQRETMENICIANSCYDFEGKQYIEEVCNQVSSVVSEGFDEFAANFWLNEELINPESQLEMKKYIGLIGEFEDKQMNGKYYEYMRNLQTQKNLKPKEQTGIQSRAYNINSLIMDINTSRYHIPIYQRNYVWDEKSINRLFSDILENEYINLNNVTFHSSSFDAKRYEIIDGQQRLTTLFLMLVAIKRYLCTYFSTFDQTWAEENEELLSSYYYLERELFEGDKISTNFIRIEGNDDYKAFQALMNGEKGDISIHSTQVYKNYVEIYKLISKLDRETLAMFIERFLNKVIFIVTVDCVSDEFTLFENLNTTSIPLSTIDLIKSYMLSLISDEIEGKEIRFQAAFDEKITNALKVDKGYVNVDNFMRVYIRTHNKVLDKKATLLEQYKTIHKIPRGSLNFAQVNEILDELNEKLEMYKYLSKKVEFPNVDNMKGLKVEDFIETIGERDIYLPTMMYLSDKYMKGELSSNQVRNLLFELERFEVIFKICSYRGQSLSIALDNVLMSLDQSKEFTTEQLVTILKADNTIGKTLAISKTAFEKKFKEFEFKEQISKIVLTRITNYLKNNKSIELNPSDSTRRIYGASLEHIMPMNGKKWIDAKVVTEQQHQHYVGNIGNHLILEESLNKKNRDKLFLEKIEIIKEQTHMEDDLTYRKGQNGTGFEVKELQEFNAKTIEERQKFLTKLALEIWR